MNNNKPTILTIDDDEHQHTYLKAILKNEYNTNSQFNGNEGLNEALNNPCIDLILMDLKMPGMFGDEATKDIRKKYQNLPIIAVTATNTLEIHDDFMNSGGTDFILKPFSPVYLKEKIQKYL